ncbi:RNA polymerase sigma factor [Pseudochryseolinea flava]|uniref:RNA polymerase subunit sigma-70 n=1 Tax=Pseudochryseolinea flava TaxID=2059302 RepID=A0A364Y608_9BACT|nr:sigma-70 family RNA polymerase sigma factor [Pseudochryseolinea flava]RAW02309.1 RNA polymerase subunit sigma-70 [Pseudochryseolinea flava]
MNHTNEKDRFIAILRENKGILLKVIRSYCKNAEDWRDLEQEIVIQLWKSLRSYNQQCKLSTWIYRVALNVAISHYRKTKKQSNHASLDEAIFIVAEDDVSEYHSRRDFLYNFINTLDEMNKALIILHLEDHSHKEISDILGISEGNVATKINRIKNKCRNAIQHNYDYTRSN